MDYMRTKTDGQLALTQTTEWLHFPSALHGFHNTNTTRERAESGRNVFCFHGLLDINPYLHLVPDVLVFIGN